MDAVSDPTVREIVVMKSAQVGWTEILGNVVGFHVDRDPAPILLVQPTLEMAEAWSKDRLAPMIRDTPALSGRIKDARARDSGNTLLHKTFPGGHVTIAGANSPAGLASRPIRIVLCDEVDRYPASAGTEGDPIALARKRSTTFWNRKLLMGSTPTVEGASRIALAYEGSDKRQYLVCCPHCHEEQRLEWPNVKWPEGEPRKAYYACPHCGGVIENQHKLAMLRTGRWEATAEFDGVAGFHINELYSPWVGFGDTAAAFVEAKRTPETLQTWVNTALGETWADRGEAPTFDRVLQLRAEYQSREVPDGVLVITAGCDVQKDRIYYVVRGWGHEMASWLLEFGVVYGETDKPEVWERLADVLASDYGGRRIKQAFIDSGYRPDAVYAFCRANTDLHAAPSKGQETLSIPVRMSRVDVTYRGQTIKHGQTLWHVDAGYFKGIVHSRIDWPQGQPGAWHLPADISDDYAKQVIAESKITLSSGKVVWKRHDRENHALDCDVYATAAARMLGMDRLRKGTQRGLVHQSPSEAPQPQPPPPQRRMMRRRGRLA